MPSVNYSVTSGSGVRVNGAVNSSGADSIFNGSRTTTFYTAPANGYAIIHLHSASITASANYPWSSSVTFRIGGRPVASASSGGAASTVSFGFGYAFYIGPGQSLDVVFSAPNSTSASCNAPFTGVEFINSV